ncbi:MAG: ATP-dependent DNA helicase RecG [Christensenellales bacterium]|jgi:ATP-dependent DNA helicase RecG
MELTKLKGVGQVIKKSLNELGIFTIRQLCLYLPVSYLDLSRYTDIKDIKSGNYYLIKAEIISLSALKRGRKASSFKAVAESDNIKIDLIWFNQAYMYDKIVKGKEYTFFAKAANNGRLIFYNPAFEEAGAERKLKGILPVYRTKGLIRQATMRKIISDAAGKAELFSALDGDTDYLRLDRAVTMLHSPQSVEEGLKARERIIEEEIINQILCYRLYNSKAIPDKKREYKNLSYDELSAILPYQLTESQRDAISDIIKDLSDTTPMNRLLMGDVGSGKTVVALIAAFIAAKNGYQAAILAPTTILAKQHYNTAGYLARSGVRVGLLTKDTPDSEKREIIRGLSEKSIDVLIGTHIIYEDYIKFNNLGLIVTDELQRFGVMEKYKFENKGYAVDTLVLSATPIPRALQLTLYDELKVSYIHKIKTDTVTSIVPPEKFQDMYDFLRREIAMGRQGYIVCPAIEDMEGVELSSAQSVYGNLLKGALKGVNIAVIHGGVKPEEKLRIMNEFNNNRIKALIATTVIETGIDVKNATVMIILNAERFGLSTLHQLRGRVGRGDNKSFCLLCTEDINNPRLKALKKYDDGFKIAEIDYELRGAGDFLGTRQSGGGFPLSRELVIKCRQAADRITIDEKLIATLIGLNKSYKRLENGIALN